MTVSNFLHICLPRYLLRIDDGKYVVLNLSSKPIGFDIGQAWQRSMLGNIRKKAKMSDYLCSITTGSMGIDQSLISFPKALCPMPLKKSPVLSGQLGLATK